MSPVSIFFYVYEYKNESGRGFLYAMERSLGHRQAPTKPRARPRGYTLLQSERCLAGLHMFCWNPAVWRSLLYAWWALSLILLVENDNHI